MSADEQHRATERARKHRAKAEALAGRPSLAEPIGPTELIGAALVHLLLAIEDRLTYGSESILSGTVSCRTCRVILLEPNAEDHYKWHRMRGEG